MQFLPLQFENGSHLKIREEKFKSIQAELEEFLANLDYLNTENFAHNVMFSYELKANNQIEGYNDDIELILDIIKKKYEGINNALIRRVMNLYDGYNYILNHQEINKESLRELYHILANGLLDPYDIKNMGEYYRNAKVFILFGGSLSTTPDEGVDVSRIDEFMNAYFNFLNNLDFSKDITSEYIKSQILHFYFVYIHPFFDVNGRTSRTLAMWYLLNKKCYPYIIFNRGITFKGSEYDKTIIKSKKSHDVSSFIEFMLKTVKIELEKEYIIESIANSVSTPLSSEEYQILLYLISMKGNLTVSDFAVTYNYFNGYKKTKEIYETMILPLREKGILEVERTSSKCMFNNTRNEILKFNPEVMNYERKRIKRLTKYK